MIVVPRVQGGCALLVAAVMPLLILKLCLCEMSISCKIGLIWLPCSWSQCCTIGRETFEGINFLGSQNLA